MYIERIIRYIYFIVKFRDGFKLFKNNNNSNND